MVNISQSFRVLCLVRICYIHEKDMLCAVCRCIGLDADGANGLMREDFDFHLKDSYSSLRQSRSRFLFDSSTSKARRSFTLEAINGARLEATVAQSNTGLLLN